MNIIKQVKDFKDKTDGQILFNENLSKYSWFNLGGPAKIIFKPKNLNELSAFLKVIKGFTKINLLGAGSNTLIRDGGFDGVIIKLGKSFSRISLFDKNTIIAGASTLERDLSSFACTHSISGFEFLSCIPGSVGGGIRMNSGCYGEDISKILLSVQAIDLNGQVKVIHSHDINFFYRGSNLTDDLIFISATFKGSTNTEKNIKEKIDSLVKKKKKNKTSKKKTGGSTFKNPPIN